MEPRQFELEVIEAAESLAKTLGPDPNHTVAAAVLDTRGRIHTGVNLYHFTGGPCAELVALGVAATAEAGPLVAVAAAGARGLIPPCGRCRQVMLDLHPDLAVAVPTGDGPRMRPVVKLLPDTYFFPGAHPDRVLRFNRSHYGAVAAREKTSTVRWDEAASVGRAVLYFEEDDRPPFPGEILAVNRYRLDELTPARLRLTGQGTVEAYLEGLRRHYPGMPADAVVDIVDFTRR